MLCQLCHAAEATVNLIETTGAKQISLHICEGCAQKRHLGEILSKPAMAIHDLLASILQLGAAPVADGAELKCPRCGLDYIHFTQIGRFGCAQCYDVFQERLLPLLRQFHQAEEHRGRCCGEPDHKPGERRAGLKEAIGRAVAAEDYETAARLRDQLQNLERTDRP
jgi:protein arginine kinase activator